MADIHQQLTLKAPRARVFEAISTPQGLSCWWTKSAAGDAKEGEEYRLFFGSGYDWRGKVTRCIPPAAFEITMTRAHADWMGTRVGFQLDAEGQNLTRMRFYHAGWPTQNEHWRVSCYCWAMYLRLLRRYLEYGELVPYESRLEV